VQKAPFAVRLEKHPRCDLGRSKSLGTLKMEAVYSSETSVLTRVTRCNVSKDIYHESFPLSVAQSQNILSVSSKLHYTINA
jgi:hypothetical protein